MEEPKNNLCILMQKDSGLKSKVHQNLRKFKKIRLLQRKLMKLVAKPHHLHTIEREKGAQPQRVPNVPYVSLVRCGMRECHKGFMRKNHTLDQKKWKHLDFFLLLSQNTKSFVLHILARNSHSLAPLLPCFPLHVLFVYLTFLPHLSSSMSIPTNPSQNASTHFSLSVHFVTPPKLLKHASSLSISKD